MAGPLPGPGQSWPPHFRRLSSSSGCRLDDMPWHECKHCGWWQRSAGPCKGCSPLDARAQPRRQGVSKPLETAQVALTPQLLQERWNKARSSALDPSHRRVERVCRHCFSKTLSKTGPCKGCGHPMTNCLQVHPGQWPPLGAMPDEIALYEPKATAAAPGCRISGSGTAKTSPLARTSGLAP